MVIDTSRRLQSVYVPAGDGIRLAVDVWLPTAVKAPPWFWAAARKAYSAWTLSDP